MAPRLNRIVAGILKQGDRVLLVQQQGQGDSAPTWAFPGGLVEDGELLYQALQREILEETGLEVEQVANLAYLTQMDNPLESTRSFAFIFEVAGWSGLIQTNDPDQVVLRAAFMPLAEAIQLLQALPWRAMREPAVAFLDGSAPTGAVWFYRLRADGSEDLVERL